MLLSSHFTTMNQVIYCGFRKVSGEKSLLRDSTLRKGRKIFAAGHIDSVKEMNDLSSSTITAKCLSQVSTTKIYNVSINLSTNRTLKQARCSCKAGISGKCKHVAGLIIYINEYNDNSKTTERQSWGIPKVKDGYSKGKKLNELFTSHQEPIIVPNVSVQSLPITFPGIQCILYSVLKAEEDTKEQSTCQVVMRKIVDTICANELDHAITHFYRLSNPETYFGYEGTLVGLKIILKRKNVCPSKEVKEYYEKQVSIAQSDMIRIAKTTQEQSLCPIWKSIRKCRLSSSICHRVITRLSAFNELAVSILSNAFTGNNATRYGLYMEREAKMSFSKYNRIPLLDCGVIICSNYPWLCCSPDAIYYKDGVPNLLEIKCPFTRMNQIITDGNRSHVKYVIYDGKSFVIKETHPYYTQVQISMFVTNTLECSFMVFSSIDSLTLTVNRNESFLKEYIPKLEYFYFNHYLPAFLEKE